MIGAHGIARHGGMMAKARRKRQSYTDAQRNQILETASREGLTALDVKKKFGVTPVTYYSWRKKSGASSGRRGRVAARGPQGSSSGGDLGSQLRTEVRQKIQQILPGIVKSEVAQYVDSLFGARRGRRRGA
jgi:transposase-like protein